MRRRKQKRSRKYLLEIAQWASAVMVLGGVVCEFILKADLYFVLITAGAIFWGIVQKMKHPSR